MPRLYFNRKTTKKHKILVHKSQTWVGWSQNFPSFELQERRLSIKPIEIFNYWFLILNNIWRQNIGFLRRPHYVFVSQSLYAKLIWIETKKYVQSETPNMYVLHVRKTPWCVGGEFFVYKKKIGFRYNFDSCIYFET